MGNQLEGKVAIVTGGASGIGKAVCEGFAEVGAKTVVADVDEKGATKLAASLKEQFGDEHIATRTDVSNKASVDAMIQAALDAFGTVDILVNNAGINIPRLLVDPAGKEELTEDCDVAILDKDGIEWKPLDIDVSGQYSRATVSLGVPGAFWVRRVSQKMGYM